jgi:PLP dependent protein
MDRMTDRRGELAENLGAVRRRIAVACGGAGRDPGEVTLIAVTKKYPASDVRLLAELGVADVGENRDQDAAPKAAACAGLGVRWHFVGQLQSNKTRSVAAYADAVHSIDRPSLVRALSAAATRAGREIGAFVQVNLDTSGAGRGGAEPADVPALADAVASASGLRLDGLMAVAPLVSAGRPDLAREAFDRLAALSARLRERHPGAAAISAGMSGDLESAIAAGATHVRVGTALLGIRPRLL